MLTGTLEGFKKWILMSESERKKMIKDYESQNKNSRQRGNNMTQEELVNKLEKVGINGEWVKPDEYGFSRIFQFKLDEQIIEIEWYCNYCTLMIGNMHFWFDRIGTWSISSLGNYISRIGYCLN